MAAPVITFVRLTEGDLDAVTALLNEPRNARHLPLAAGEAFTIETAADWVASKDGQWDEHGYGSWARPTAPWITPASLPSVPAHQDDVVSRITLLRPAGALRLPLA